MASRPPIFGPTGSKTQARVVMNRQAMDALDLAVADALANLAREVLQDAKRRVPVDTGNLRDSGDWAVFNGARKVAGTGSKPRALRTSRGVISAVVGFGSPLAHLIERGTALRANETPSRSTGRGPAIPFLLPAAQEASASDLAREVEHAIARRGLSRPS